MNVLSWPIWTVMLIGAFCGGSLRAEDQLDWNPQKTWVFTVGLLEWEHADLWSSMPAAKKDRRDKQLVEFFRDAGVPEDQITYLHDTEATKSRINKEFQALLEQTEEGDLLVFYFCGHGCRDQETGRTCFANYDAGKKDGSAWEVESIFETIETNFHGSRALLLADCCHSGALFDLAQKRPNSKIPFAVLTSSYSHNTSTGRWTFSDSVLAGLRGEPQVDLNADGTVDLQELARYCELEMAFVEGQKSMFSAGSKFSGGTRLASAQDALERGVGERLEVQWKGKWYKAKTIAGDGERRKIHYATYDSSWDEWVEPARMRPYQPAHFNEGAKVQVKWETDQKWYPATVRKSWRGLHFVRYDGYGETWDEWVGPGAIRQLGE